MSWLAAHYEDREVKEVLQIIHASEQRLLTDSNDTLDESAPLVSGDPTATNVTVAANNSIMLNVTDIALPGVPLVTVNLTGSAAASTSTTVTSSTNISSSGSGSKISESNVSTVQLDNEKILKWLWRIR